MLFDFATLSPNIRYKLLVSTVVPRPIAWVVSQDVHGVLNAAPYSFFNAFSSEPPVIGIGVGRRSSGHAKDTRANIVETGEFVVNLVAEETASAMNVTAIASRPRTSTGPPFDRLYAVDPDGVAQIRPSHGCTPRSSPPTAHASSTMRPLIALSTTTSLMAAAR